MERGRSTGPWSWGIRFSSTKAWIATRSGWPIQIEADKIMGQIGFSSFAVFFRNDPEYDEGLWEEIDEWNQRHKITCYAMVPVPLPEIEP